MVLISGHPESVCFLAVISVQLDYLARGLIIATPRQDIWLYHPSEHAAHTRQLLIAI
jgi:hypothetical protein